MRVADGAVAWSRGHERREYPGSVKFSDPWTKPDRRDLRWYLEEYLRFPYGAERFRAEQVERRMAAWGESLFKQVFVKGKDDPDPRLFYQEAVGGGLDDCELRIASDDEGFLNIPWELMRDPAPDGATWPRHSPALPAEKHAPVVAPIPASRAGLSVSSS